MKERLSDPVHLTLITRDVLESVNFVLQRKHLTSYILHWQLWVWTLFYKENILPCTNRRHYKGQNAFRKETQGTALILQPLKEVAVQGNPRRMDKVKGFLRALISPKKEVKKRRQIHPLELLHPPKSPNVVSDSGRLLEQMPYCVFDLWGANSAVWTPSTFNTLNFALINRKHPFGVCARGMRLKCFPFIFS